jgi:glycine cleavage system pyridoxal-binding protein P
LVLGHGQMAFKQNICFSSKLYGDLQPEVWQGFLELLLDVSKLICPKICFCKGWMEDNKTNPAEALAYTFGFIKGSCKRFCVSSLTYWFCDDVSGNREVLPYTKLNSSQQTKYSSRKD